MIMPGSSLRDLATLRDYRALRSSSWDQTGGNKDYWVVEPGQTRVLADLSGPGCLTHLWTTISCGERDYLRKLVLRIYWDGEENPSVECPVGDFFGLGHAATTYFSSAALSMWDRAFNCYFPMPFANGARVEVTSECDTSDTVYYFYIDYEQYTSAPDNVGRFHAQWRREWCEAEQLAEERNIGGAGNYVILEAKGRGHYVGCHLDIDAETPGWWGEGDDMFFIDGEKWPPSLHGTGTEDYFCGAWNYNRLKETFCTPYYGYHFKTNADYTGKHSQYRYHIQDPIPFQESLLFSIEHGHANNMSHDYSSTAYWYQTEPHCHCVELLPVEKRLPRLWGGLHI
ncbi:MAG: glycoside hydrolase family 172 protein [Armatimonadia bacterium]